MTRPKCDFLERNPMVLQPSAPVQYTISLLSAITHLTDALASGEATVDERSVITNAHERLMYAYTRASARAREGQSARQRRKVPRIP